jgi:hypothetical protein
MWHRTCGTCGLQCTLRHCPTTNAHHLDMNMPNMLSILQSYGSIFCNYFPGFDYTCGLQGSQVPSSSITASNTVGGGFSVSTGIKIKVEAGAALDFELSSSLCECSLPKGASRAMHTRPCKTCRTRVHALATCSHTSPCVPLHHASLVLPLLQPSLPLEHGLPPIQGHPPCSCLSICPYPLRPRAAA